MPFLKDLKPPVSQEVTCPNTHGGNGFFSRLRPRSRRPSYSSVSGEEQKNVRAELLRPTVYNPRVEQSNNHIVEEDEENDEDEDEWGYGDIYLAKKSKRSVFASLRSSLRSRRPKWVTVKAA